jgi:hypothetical protein
MPLYSDNQTCPDAEKNGILVEFSDFWFRCARAGGANKEYAKVLERKSRRLRGEADSGKLSEDKARGVLKEVYAETIVKEWGGPGLLGPDDKPLECTSENVLKVLQDLDMVYDRVYSEVTLAKNYLKSMIEEDSGNS